MCYTCMCDPKTCHSASKTRLNIYEIMWCSRRLGDDPMVAPLDDFISTHILEEEWGLPHHN